MAFFNCLRSWRLLYFFPRRMAEPERPIQNASEGPMGSPLVVSIIRTSSYPRSRSFCIKASMSPYFALVDDAITISEFYFLESIPAEDFCPRNAMFDSTPHKVYDASLKHYANLHRFLNKAGEPYSAIYVGRDERLSCERTTSKA